MAYEEELTQAVVLIKAGKKLEAVPLLKNILKVDREVELAWLWLSACVETRDNKKYCYQEALRINPANPHAKKALEQLEPAPMGPIVSVPIKEKPEANNQKTPIAPVTYKGGHAGKSTREMARGRRKTALWMAFGGIGLVLIVGILLTNSSALRFGGIAILVLLVILKILPDLIVGRVDKKLKEERRAIRGAKAEEKIGELLAGLSDEFLVMNDVESQYGNIDHIVISKYGGIFLLETKAHGGKVGMDGETLLVNGKIPEKDFIAQALKNSYWLRDQVNPIVGFQPWITPIIVFANAFVSGVKPVKGVRIINKKYLVDILQKANRFSDANAKIWEQRETIESHLIQAQ
jgi:hypothetical protein